jgi:alpha-tubulin suppressor-like RCC1 family protein
MPYLGRIPPLSAPRARGGRGARFARRLAPVLAQVLMVAALGCREDTESPTGPGPAPALDLTPAQALSFREVSTGGYPGNGGHTCGVTTDDRAYCWGFNQSGELGIGTNDGPEDCGNPCSTRPVAVLGGLRFRHVSAGDRFTCGITTDDRAYCWGRNFEGQLGVGESQVNHFTPAPVAGTRRFRQVQAGVNHTCAITPFDVAFCWGWNGEGELGDGTTTQRFTPVRVAGGLHWLQLTAAYVHTCGVTTDDRAYCWGSNGTGALGDGTTTRRLRPVPVAGGLPFRQIDAGFGHTCAVTTADRAYCWGWNGSGALGDGTTASHRTPTVVFGKRYYDHVSAGAAYTCGVTRAHRGFCWGSNGGGQLGTGSIAYRLTPTALGVDLSMARVSASLGGSTCGVTTDQRAYCWGDNIYGQLGDGTTATRLLPVSVAGPI